MKLFLQLECSHMSPVDLAQRQILKGLRICLLVSLPDAVELLALGPISE